MSLSAIEHALTIKDDSRAVLGVIPPSSAQIERIATHLFTLFESREEFMKMYGAKSVNYLCHLSTRYALWVSPEPLRNDELAMKALSLWLTLVWIVDGVFDKHQQAAQLSYRQTLLDVIVNDCSPPEGESLFGVVLELFSTIYRHYLQLVQPYRERNEEAFQRLITWFARYIHTLPPTTQASFDLDSYRSWRLESGAIMCVVWQLAMLSETPIEDEEIFKEISLIVSYHNDLLSFDRDRRDGTPNLVSLFYDTEAIDNQQRPVSNDHHSAFKRAISYVNKMYERIWSCPLSGLEASILNGSYCWTNAEERYKVGLRLVRFVVEGGSSEEFNKILTGCSSQTAGDPRIG